jgi:hypothetical protein
MLSDIMLSYFCQVLMMSVIMSCVGMLNVILLYVTMLSVIMPGVGMLIVIMLSVINECCYAECN